MNAASYQVRLTAGKAASLRARRSVRCGFTLLELILVLVIISTVLALAAPSMERFWASSHAHDAAVQVLAVAQWARMQAVSDARMLRLNLDTKGGTYWLTQQDDSGGFTRVASEFGRTFSVPDGTRLELVRTDVQQQPAFRTIVQTNTAAPGSYVQFAPDGRAEPATIQLTDSKGGQTRVVCASPTEAFRIIGSEARGGGR